MNFDWRMRISEGAGTEPRNARIVIAAMAAALGCAACGFKGPLYLPEQNAAVVTHPAPGTKVAPGPSQRPPAKTKRKKQQSPAAPAPGP